MDLSETREQTIGEVQKTQNVRLWDVFAIGPALLYLATKKELTGLHKAILVVIGGGTIIYNLNNYRENRKKNGKR
tara:strand:- start:331 stop:555 length:225 start_codon:yes stop_codon:yes gene_type:complete